MPLHLSFLPGKCEAIRYSPKHDGKKVLSIEVDTLRECDRLDLNLTLRTECHYQSLASSHTSMAKISIAVENATITLLHFLLAKSIERHWDDLTSQCTMIQQSILCEAIENANEFDSVMRHLNYLIQQIS